MRIDNFIWLQAIVEKLAVKHQISPEEVEEVFLNEPRYRYVESGYRTGEDVYAALGRTDSGRYVIIFFVLKDTSSALILSARNMDKNERRLYERK